MRNRYAGTLQPAEKRHPRAVKIRGQYQGLAGMPIDKQRSLDEVAGEKVIDGCGDRSVPYSRGPAGNSIGS